MILWDTIDLIEEAGYVAYGAANADEAIALLETRPDIRVLFTDIDMPGSMDGLKLAAAVFDRWPPVTIIVASGQVNVTAARLPNGATFLAKPYRPNSVLEALRQAGARAPGR